MSSWLARREAGKLRRANPAQATTATLARTKALGTPHAWAAIGLSRVTRAPGAKLVFAAIRILVACLLHSTDSLGSGHVVMVPKFAELIGAIKFAIRIGVAYSLSRRRAFTSASSAGTGVIAEGRGHEIAVPLDVATIRQAIVACPASPEVDELGRAHTPCRRHFSKVPQSRSVMHRVHPPW